MVSALSDLDCAEERISEAREIAFHLTDWNPDAAFLVGHYIFFQSDSRRRNRGQEWAVPFSYARPRRRSGETRWEIPRKIFSWNR